MEKRQKKIKEIESLIEKNRGLRREFISSLGKTVALDAMTAMGIVSFSACEKDEIDLNELKSGCFPPHTCGINECTAPEGFDCPSKHSCTNMDYCEKTIHRGGLAS